MIKRKIYLSEKNCCAPICTVCGSQMPIGLELADYAIPDGAAARVFVQAGTYGQKYVQDCSIDGNLISFSPVDGFFRPGDNRVQVKISMGEKILFTFFVDVVAEENLETGDAAGNPEAVMSLVQRTEGKIGTIRELLQIQAQLLSDLGADTAVVEKMQALLDALQEEDV